MNAPRNDQFGLVNDCLILSVGSYYAFLTVEAIAKVQATTKLPIHWPPPPEGWTNLAALILALVLPLVLGIASWNKSSRSIGKFISPLFWLSAFIVMILVGFSARDAYLPLAFFGPIPIICAIGHAFYLCAKNFNPA